MRSIWTGAISFGLVNIPVKLYSATEERELKLNMLDSKDYAKIKYIRVNENSGKEVPWENIVKAYKLGDDYVVLEDEDFEYASPEKSKTIDIKHFVSEKQIDTIFFETPYYLEPDTAGAKAYALLREALEKTAKVGVATFVMRNKEALVIIRPAGKLLILERLRFAEEIREPDELNLPDNKDTVNSQELKIAVMLINQLSTKFDIKKFKNTYQEELLKLIEAKAKGTKRTKTKSEAKKTKSKDLMSQLKASLAQVEN